MADEMMEEEAIDTTVKIIVVGNGGVGKTSLIRKYCKGQFTDEYKKTIGVDFLERQIYVEETMETVSLHLWDTAGQDEFETLTRRYYHGAGAAVITFSTTDRHSFDAVRRWKQKVTEQCGADMCMALVQNKIDLLEEAVVTKEEVEALADELKVKLYRTSVKTGVNVEPIFEYLLDEYFKRGAHHEESIPKVETIGVLGSETTTGPAAAKAPGVTATSGMGVSGGGGATSGGAGSSSTATSTHKASDQTPAEVVRLDEPPASVQPSRRRAKKGFCTLL